MSEHESDTQEMDYSIRIECGELDDFELKDLSRYLAADEGIEDVISAEMEMTDAEVTPAHSGRLQIHASAAPFYIVVKFAADHWNVIAGAVGMKASDAVYDYLENRVKQWSKNRANRYDTCPLYNQDGNVLSVVKVPKKP